MSNLEILQFHGMKMKIDQIFEAKIQISVKNYRLAAALAACAQLSALPASQRMWSLQSLRRLMMATNQGLSLNIMSESQSSTSVTSPVTNTEVMSVASMTLRPLVSDTALSVLVKGTFCQFFLLQFRTFEGH